MPLFLLAHLQEKKNLQNMAAASRDCWYVKYHRVAMYNPSASAVVANIGLMCTRRLLGGFGGFKAISPKYDI